MHPSHVERRDIKCRGISGPCGLPWNSLLMLIGFDPVWGFLWKCCQRPSISGMVIWGRSELCWIWFLLTGLSSFIPVLLLRKRQAEVERGYAASSCQHAWTGKSVQNAAFVKNKPFQAGHTPLTSCPGYCHLKFTSTSGSPRTVQTTWTLSLTPALLDNAAIEVEGGPLGTETKTVFRNRKLPAEVKYTDKTESQFLTQFA